MAILTSQSLKASESFRKIITSAKDSVRTEQWTPSAAEMEQAGAAGCRINKRTLAGGKQDGVELIEVDNGKLKLTIIPTRGMSVLEVRMGDLRLGWNSPVKELVHPKYMNLQSRGGLGWLEGFNEWMVRCGLEFAGHPGRDKFINNVGDEAEMDLTLHGKIGNIPASEVEVVIDPAPSHRIRVRGRLDERMFYGPKLELWTEISTEPGSDTFRIDDQITNHGAFDQEFQLIYHANYGPPLLEQGSRFYAPLEQITPFNANAAKSVGTFSSYDGPTKGFIEQVYCLRPLADDSGRTRIALVNAARDKAVSMAFAVEQLPYLTLWKNTNAEEEGYVTGLEPGTGFPFNRRVERHFKRVPKLKPAESRQFGMEVSILSTADQVKSTLENIAKIQASTKPVLDLDPMELPEAGQPSR